MSLLFPTLPDGLDLPTQYFVSLYILKPSQVAGGRMQGTQVRALGQDTQLHSSRCSFGVEIMLQVGGLQATCMHVQYIGRKGRITLIFQYQFYGVYNFKRKYSISGRQGKIGNQDTPIQGSQRSDLKVFFLPLMQYECYLEVLPLTFALEVFCIYTTAVVCMDFDWDRIRR